ncbi:hypothetical protein CRENBAI_015363 [Crenichthys baileyi]|uniref:Uncharacterized protein n=1 Tax=Crenichthys baileyi TaxID=28760 RepID=A0AAV9QR57_9TELE
MQGGGVDVWEAHLCTSDMVNQPCREHFVGSPDPLFDITFALLLHPPSVSTDFEGKQLDFSVLSLLLTPFFSPSYFSSFLCAPILLPLLLLFRLAWILLSSSLHSEAIKPLVSPSADNETSEVV